MRKPIFVIVLLIFVVSGFIGWWFLNDSKSNQSSTAPVAKITKSNHDKETTDHKTARNAQATLYDRVRNAKLENFAELLNEISLLTDEELKRKLTAQLVDRWIATNGEDLKNFLAALKNGGEHATRFLPLLGQSFVDLGERVTTDYFYPLANSFASVDFNGAVSWSANVVSSERDVFPCIEIFGNLTKKNQAEAVAQALAIPPNSIRPLVMEHLAYNWSKEDFAGAMEIVKKLPANEQTNFVSEYFRDLSYKDPARASEILSTTTDPLVLKHAATSFGETSYYSLGHAQAMSLAEKLPTPEARWEAVAAVYSEWSANNPLEAVNDALQGYPENPELATRFFAKAITGRNDEDIMKALAKVESPEWQMNGYLGAFESIGQFKGFDEMDQLLTHVNENDRDRALSALASAAAKNAPEAAMKWAAQISDPELSASISAKVSAEVKASTPPNRQNGNGTKIKIDRNRKPRNGN
jgi:hypothetical protein